MHLAWPSGISEVASNNTRAATSTINTTLVVAILKVASLFGG